MVSRQNGAGERGPSERGRVRTCVGCGERVDVADARGARPLVRLILGPSGVIAVDPGDGGFGRGAHVHPRRECLSAAVARGLARAAKGRVHTILGGAGLDGAAPSAEGAGEGTPEGAAPLTVVSLARAIREATDRRIQGLVGAAVRAQSAAIGADAVAGACARGEASLVLVACDAAAGADLPEVRRAIAEGRAVAWGSKQVLGALAGGPRERGVAVMAISSASIAAAVASAVHVVDTCARIERGEDPATGERGSPGRRGRPARHAPARAEEGGNPEPLKTAPGHGGPEHRRRPGRPGVASEHPEPGARLSPQEAGKQPGSPEGAPGSREERPASRGGAGRFLATAPETGEGGAVGGRRAESGEPGRAPTVDRVAANRRPRGWVRRIG
ncbi:DUF448 domain-containing protein [Sorangium sp. So ce1036]|uniref:DUF448 domain-containing protein n=1 Tax=Sorangium sp. So ce1036 TaxID=3133328 RepID=UPI003F11EB57